MGSLWLGTVPFDIIKETLPAPHMGPYDDKQQLQFGPEAFFRSNETS